MNAHTKTLPPFARPTLLAFGAVMLLSGIFPSLHAESGFDVQSEPGVRAIADAELAPFRVRLIELAFRSASAYPSDPHLKSRCRAQERVVAACLELDQPRRVVPFIRKIDNWRRGAAYADLAFHLARKGHRTAELREYLEKADKIAHNRGMDRGNQAWRRDRVKVKIARALVVLGEDRRAAELESGVAQSEVGKVAVERVAKLDADGFDAEMKRVDAVLQKGHLDHVRAVLVVCVRAYDRFYDDATRRDAAELRVKTGHGGLPVDIRIAMVGKLAEVAHAHDDDTRALALVNHAQGLLEPERWLANHLIPIQARLAALRYRVGDEKRARRDLEDALAHYKKERENILNFERAETVRPLAEAYRSMNDPAAALTIYKLAVAEGAVNPNARPRADDLTDNLISLALHEVEPDEELWTKLQSTYEGLSDPW